MPDLRRILKVARREFAETVRTKMFLAGLLLTPLFLVIVIYFAGKSAAAVPSSRQAKTVAVVDQTGQLSSELASAFKTYNEGHRDRQVLLRMVEDGPEPAQLDREKQKVSQGQLDALAVVEAGVLDGPGKVLFHSRQIKASEMDWLSTAENLLNQAVVSRRCQLRGVSVELLNELRRHVNVEQVVIGPQQQESRARRGDERIVMTFMVPFMFMLLIYVGVMGTGQQMLTSIVEEKSSRIVEVLLSAVSPLELMAGKIIGLAGVGLVMIGVWAAAAWVSASARGLTLDVGDPIAPYFLIYFVLGYLLISCLFAGIGSVCNSLKEAQGLMMPITLVLIVPMVSWMSIAQDPNGVWGRVLSAVPLTTSMVMILRMAAGAEFWPGEVVVSIVWLAGWVVLAMWASAKVFRTGLLMYGKRPGLREIARWLRQR
jgi:ABC-2 type transport system permease protein